MCLWVFVGVSMGVSMGVSVGVLYTLVNLQLRLELISGAFDRLNNCNAALTLARGIIVCVCVRKCVCCLHTLTPHTLLNAVHTQMISDRM